MGLGVFRLVRLACVSIYGRKSRLSVVLGWEPKTFPWLRPRVGPSSTGSHAAARERRSIVRTIGPRRFRRRWRRD